MALVSTTVKVISTGDENTEATLVSALVGVPAQELADEITIADESPDTSTSPAPLITMVCPIPLSTGITFGSNEVTDTISNTPASKYGDTVVHRTHT